jgi:2-polyprenyl-6-methoxyphenol hydroxylase-like FAD-dependent oxidoreductase
MYARNAFAAAPALLAIPRRRRAVVVGGSLAGLLAARVLSDHFGRVTLLERDHYTGTLRGRKGVPQSHHVHVLLERGRGAMERLLPGLTEELVQAGAEPLDASRDVAWMGPYGWYVRFPGDQMLLASSRNLIDGGIRRRVAALPNVSIHERANVAGLIPGPGDECRVAGVRLRSGTTDAEPEGGGVELAADLVVVADGRNSHLPEWLTVLGCEPPEETVVNSSQGYASRLYRPPAGFLADWKALYIQQAPPRDPRGGLVSPVEGGGWLVSLVGGDGDYPPTNEAGFLAFARSLRSPALYEAIVKAEPLSPIAGQRATENRLRQYDRLTRFPDGVVAVGDAVCAFNPVYGQGMTAAALGAEVLDRWLRETPAHRGPLRGRHFQRRLARATAAAWQFSAGADYRFRTTEGPAQGRLAQLSASYVAGVMVAATRRPGIRRRLQEVLHLLRRPAALFGPGVLARLAWDWLAGQTDACYRRLVQLRERSESRSPTPHSRAPGLAPRIETHVK